MRGKHREGESHNCSRPCGSPLCAEDALKKDADADAKSQVESAEPTIPPWLVGLLGVSGSGVVATIGYLYTKGGKANKTNDKKKKRALKTPRQSHDVEESTETTALTQPQSAAVAAVPSPTVQHQYVAAYHPTLALPHGGSFVAQAMPVTHISEPIVAHHSLGAISAPPVVNQIPAMATMAPTVTHAAASVAAFPASSTVVTHPAAAHQYAHAHAVGGLTPVPAISTPVASYYHQQPTLPQQ